MTTHEDLMVLQGLSHVALQSFHSGTSTPSSPGQPAPLPWTARVRALRGVTLSANPVLGAPRSVALGARGGLESSATNPRPRKMTR
eukprot:4472999-Prymnesium_polylepis.1